MSAPFSIKAVPALANDLDISSAPAPAFAALLAKSLKKLLIPLSPLFATWAIFLNPCCATVNCSVMSLANLSNPIS